MKRYYIPHKLSPGDITNLSDSDSELIINEKSLSEEDVIEIESPDKIFSAQVTFIDKASVEVQIKQLLQEKEKSTETQITVVQSITNEKRMKYFLEKITEIGVDRIIPVETEYSKRSLESARRSLNSWRSVVREATDQSRNPAPPTIEKPIPLSELNINSGKKICLSSEEISKEYFPELIDDTNQYTIAIGPETGWSSADLETLKTLNFQFAKLKGNILRTETAGVVGATIIKTTKKEI